jgi:predicted restriction endonuclease
MPYKPGYPSEKKGKTYEELYGVDQAREIRLKQSILRRAKADANRGDDRAGIVGDYREREWASAVKKRDNYTCRKCGRDNLAGQDCHAHHIKPWDKFPELRFDIDNGLTLCAACHAKVSVQENKRKFAEYWKTVSTEERTRRGRNAAFAFWDKLSPEEKSEHGRRRSSFRKKKT